MPSIYQPRITRYVGPDGKRCRKGDPGSRKVRKKCRKWWGKYTDDAGTQHTAPLSTNRTAALRMLADLVDTGADPYRRWASVLLTGPDGHLAAFADHQRAEGVTEAHVLAVAGQLARVNGIDNSRQLPYTHHQTPEDVTVTADDVRGTGHHDHYPHSGHPHP